MCLKFLTITSVDPLKTSQGILSFRALRLSQKMMDLYAEKEFTPSRYSCAHC